MGQSFGSSPVQPRAQEVDFRAAERRQVMEVVGGERAGAGMPRQVLLPRAEGRENGSQLPPAQGRRIASRDFHVVFAELLTDELVGMLGRGRGVGERLGGSLPRRAVAAKRDRHLRAVNADLPKLV